MGRAECIGQSAGKRLRIGLDLVLVRAAFSALLPARGSARWRFRVSGSLPSPALEAVLKRRSDKHQIKADPQALARALADTFRPAHAGEEFLHGPNPNRLRAP